MAGRNANSSKTSLLQRPGLRSLGQIWQWIRRLAFGLAALAAIVLALWRRRGQPATAVIVITALLWIVYGVGLIPAISPESSAQALMQRVGERIGPEAELAMLGWREQHRLQADRPVVDFGFKRPWDEQWPLARDWLQADPSRRWLFLRLEAIGPCMDATQVIDIGASNRRAWALLPGHAWIAGCDMPAGWAAEIEHE